MALFAFFNFWDGNIPAPLKQQTGTGHPIAVGHFWDGNIPAPLKHADSGRLRRIRAHFWDGNIPAPLKHCGDRSAGEQAARFLGWKHPGPIEASAHGGSMLFQHRGRCWCVISPRSPGATLKRWPRGPRRTRESGAWSRARSFRERASRPYGRGASGGGGGPQIP